MRLVTMSPRARKALAKKWFIWGFSVSGKGFNGESSVYGSYPAIQSLIGSEFDRVYEEDQTNARGNPRAATKGGKRLRPRR